MCIFMSRRQVLSRYRELLRLVARLSEQQRDAARSQARDLLRARATEQDPQTILDHQRELASKIAFLRMTTPKRAGEVAGVSGTYVLRNGELVQGSGETRGPRVADGVMPMDEAMKRNARDFKRFYGGDKPSKVFF